MLGEVVLLSLIPNVEKGEVFFDGRGQKSFQR